VVQLIYVKIFSVAATVAILLISTVPGDASATTLAPNSNLSVGAGPGWLLFSDGGLQISANTFKGSKSKGLTGDFSAGRYYVNQYSQIEITANQLSNAQWIGPTVRAQSAGQNFYVGVYAFNNGSPYLQIFKRLDGNWAPLSNRFPCGELAAGTKLRLEVVGATLALLENGIERLTAYDAQAITGGAPGIAAFGASRGANWSAGRAGFQVNYLGMDGGIRTYDVISGINGYGAQRLRVLVPTHPTPGVEHNFLYVLPVEDDDDVAEYGDGLTTLQSLNAQNTYNLTIIAPSFGIVPWYANNPDAPWEQEETFMVSQLEPWVTSNFSTTHREQNWLIGFSKSGYGGMDLLLRHPRIFAVGSFWDFPADMSSYNQYATAALSYGTDGNFQVNYRLTSAFIAARKAPFVAKNRIWIGGYALFGTDMNDFNNLLDREGIQHLTEVPTPMAHSWDSGWVPMALSALYENSQDLNGKVYPEAPPVSETSGAIRAAQPALR
jgi:Putative esterase